MSLFASSSLLSDESDLAPELHYLLLGTNEATQLSPTLVLGHCSNCGLHRPGRFYSVSAVIALRTVRGTFGRRSISEFNILDSLTTLNVGEALYPGLATSSSLLPPPSAHAYAASAPWSSAAPAPPYSVVASPHLAAWPRSAWSVPRDIRLPFYWIPLFHRLGTLLTTHTRGRRMRAYRWQKSARALSRLVELPRLYAGDQGRATVLQ